MQCLAELQNHKRKASYELVSKGISSQQDTDVADNQLFGLHRRQHNKQCCMQPHQADMRCVDE
jgi:hypothetical protein